MPSLAELQADVHRALTAGDARPLRSVLVGGLQPLARLVIHQRHYETSLVTALLGKFPATAWLIGSDAVTHAAQRFVREHPPNRPCIAEYGADFLVFLVARDTSAARTYLQLFAELEWHIGQVSIAISETPVDWSRIVAVGADALPRSIFSLQSGVRYVHGEYAVDDLMRVYMGGSAPEQFTLVCEDTWIEVRGARGDVRLSRLDATTFIFRATLAAGLPLADAAEHAFLRDERFNLGVALQSVIAEGLVTAVTSAKVVGW